MKFKRVWSVNEIPTVMVYEIKIGINHETASGAWVPAAGVEFYEFGPGRGSQHVTGKYMLN